MVDLIRRAGLDGDRLRVVPVGRLRQIGRLVGSTAMIARQVKRWRSDLLLSWMPLTHVRSLAVSAATGVPTAWVSKTWHAER